MAQLLEVNEPSFSIKQIDTFETRFNKPPRLKKIKTVC